MISIKKMLCPVDFSDISRVALDHAVALARWYGARLDVVYAFSAVMPAAAGHPPYYHLNLGDEVRKEMIEELDRLAEPVRASGVAIGAEIIDGEPVSRILDRARSGQADLIVMGTHGSGGFERWILGSVTEKVIRKAPCPVLTVPPRVGTSPQVTFRSILCPVDFSESSLEALEYAFSLAREAGGRLTLLHVTEFLRSDQLREEIAFNLESIRSTLQRDAEDRLRRAVPDDVRTWCEVEIANVVGKPYQEILRLAGERDTDVIVMGVQGRGAIDLMLFGSTTQHVVRAATCPVLIVRSG